MSRLSEIFARKHKCFLPFVTAGYPDLETTLQILFELSESGADIIELGVPFSDPIADGPHNSTVFFYSTKAPIFFG